MALDETLISSINAIPYPLMPSDVLAAIRALTVVVEASDLHEYTRVESIREVLQILKVNVLSAAVQSCDDPRYFTDMDVFPPHGECVRDKPNDNAWRPRT